MPSRAGKSWVYGDYGVRGGVMCKVNIYIYIYVFLQNRCQPVLVTFVCQLLRLLHVF